MTSQPITKRAVDALSCPAGKDRIFLWDDSLSGFGVTAFASGKKYYVAQYRQNGRSRRLTLGQHGRLTPAEARSEAKKILGAVASGADPIEERKQSHKAQTVAAVCDLFLEEYVLIKKKPRTCEEYSRIIKLHIVPALGARRLADVHKADVARMHAKMHGRPGAANRTVSLLSTIWNWAASLDEVSKDLNPVRGLEKYRENPNERYLSSDEFARLGEALRLAETDGIPWKIAVVGAREKHVPKAGRETILDPYAVAAIRLLILTGARLREILGARWNYVDVERGVLRLPDSKTGRKPIYLSGAALALLDKLPRIDGISYIIPGGRADDALGRRDAPRTDLKKPWAAICRAAQLEGVRLHDLRHSFAATGAGESLGLPIIGKLLGHSQPSTTARYAHLDADPMRGAVNLISEIGAERYGQARRVRQTGRTAPR